jgi:nitrile hydratase
MAITAEQALGAVAAGASARVDANVEALFKVGDRVRARNINPRTHTRMPRYLHGCEGVVERDFGVFAFPDSHAHGQGDQAQHVYSVRFSAKDVWGREGGERDFLLVDMWDQYLDIVS